MAKFKNSKLYRALFSAQETFRRWFAKDLIHREIDSRINAVNIVFPDIAEKLANAEKTGKDKKASAEQELSAAQEAVSLAQTKLTESVRFIKAVELLTGKN